jgi:DNA-binding CsgD family transcriptional regulator
MNPTPTTPELDQWVRTEAEQLASRLFSNQFMVAFDLWSQQCCFISPGAEVLLGYDASQMSMDLLYHAIHPDDLPQIARATNLAIEFTQECVQQKGRALPLEEPNPLTICFSIDYRLRCKAGHYLRMLRQNFILAEASNGRPLVTGSIFTDITAHKTTLDVRFSLEHPDFPRWLQARKGGRPADELSTREQEILARILAGESNALIAKNLFISYYTVKTHRRNIQRKIKSNNISQRLAHLDAGLVRMQG